MNLPTAAEAVALTEDAIEQSGRSPEPSWLLDAEQTVRRLADKGAPFSANDVWAAGLANPGNRRSLGYVMRSLEAEGVIARTGDSTVSRWGHGQRIATWRRAR